MIKRPGGSGGVSISFFSEYFEVSYQGVIFSRVQQPNEHIRFLGYPMNMNDLHITQFVCTIHTFTEIVYYRSKNVD